VAFLTYIDCSSFEKTPVSLNDALWDEHVSFAVLSLAVSPCQQFVLAATGEEGGREGEREGGREGGRGGCDVCAF